MNYLFQELFFLLANHTSLLFDLCSWRQNVSLTKLMSAMEKSEKLTYGKLAWYSKQELRMGSCSQVRLTELWNA